MLASMNLLEATTPTRRMARAVRGGYLVAALGAVGGGIAGGSAIGGSAFALIDCDGTGFECLGIALLAAAIGVLGGLVSAVAGCYFALRWRGYERAGRTAAYMSALLPVAAGLSIFLAGLLTVFGPVLGIAGAAVAARRLAIGKQPVSNEKGNV
jgi:hypothetical protein